MTAPLVAELRHRHPGLRLTIQTALPRAMLETRYDRFDYVGDIPDIGFRMNSALTVDVEASAAYYSSLHADFAAVVDAEATRLRLAQPDLVLANVPYVTIAAAAAAGIPVVAYSSINWADMVAHYLGDRAEFQAVVAQIRHSYAQAAVFLRATPAQAMTLPNVRDIGPVACLGQNRRDEIRERLGLGQDTRVGLIAYGGINHHFPLTDWPVLDGWFWLSAMADTPALPHMAPCEAAGAPFADVLASVDLLITKPGYGTFSEAALAGIPVLYEPRRDWPESPALEAWLARHTRCLAVTPAQMAGEGLSVLLRTLFSQPSPTVATASGVTEGGDILDAMMRDRVAVCESS